MAASRVGARRPAPCLARVLRHIGWSGWPATPWAACSIRTKRPHRVRHCQIFVSPGSYSMSCRAPHAFAAPIAGACSIGFSGGSYRATERRDWPARAEPLTDYLSAEGPPRIVIADFQGQPLGHAAQMLTVGFRAQLDHQAQVVG